MNTQGFFTAGSFPGDHSGRIGGADSAFRAQQVNWGILAEANSPGFKWVSNRKTFPVRLQLCGCRGSPRTKTPVSRDPTCRGPPQGAHPQDERSFRGKDHPENERTSISPNEPKASPMHSASPTSPRKPKLTFGWSGKMLGFQVRE